MADYNFAMMPSVSIPRTKFTQTFSHNTSFNLGELVILKCVEVIPGSTHNLEYGSLIRMSTPIAPIMDDIQYDIYSFFVPMRLCWDNWKRFMGENTTGSGAINGVNSDKVIPYVETTGSAKNSIADDLGIPPHNSSNSLFKVNVLPFRAFHLIKDRWFRNQNVSSPAMQNKTDTPSWTVDMFFSGLVNTVQGITEATQENTRRKANKLPDYFTSALPYAQKGDPVSIFPSSGTLAPVVPIGDTANVGDRLHLYLGNDGHKPAADKPLAVSVNSNIGLIDSSVGSWYGTADVQGTNLFANLSASVNATINNLRFAYQLQKFLEKDANYGSRYWEILYAHYSVTSPDATLQDPQLLGHRKFDINIQQVLQTTGFTSPSSTNLGTPGANSTTGSKGDIFTASFVEHGYLMTIGVARQKRHTYSQGLNRMFSRSVRTDFYFPVFANLGAQKVLNKEIYIGSGSPDGVFGYQEAWADYRYIPSYNSGLLNPARSGSLDYWTLAENFGSAPTLGPTFLSEDRSNLARCLVTGSGGPDFIGSFYFKDTVVNPMPLYSIPGLSDHH